MHKPDEQSRVRQIAATYHAEALAGLNEQYHLYLRDQVIPVEGGRSALELGCGKGLWTQLLLQRYDRVDVVDGSPELLKSLVPGGNPRATMIAHAAMAEEFLVTCSNTWQHIYMTFLLEHLEDPVAVLQRVGMCLDPDGMLMVAVPNADSIHRVLALRAGMIRSTDELSANDILVGHRRVYTRDLLRAHLRRAGFLITEEKSIGLKPLSLKQLEGLSSPVQAALCASGDLARDHAAYLVALARPQEA